LLLALVSGVLLGSVSRETHDHILLFRIRDTPNLEGQVPLFISSRNRVVQVYPQALGSLFVASCDSQGYGGGIRPRLHTWVTIFRAAFSLNRLGMDPIEDSVSSRSSLLRNVFIATETRLSAIPQQRPSVLAPLSWSFNFYLTHSWSRALLQKLPIVQLLKNFSAFYGTRRFITAFT
jgi:hypothetical protein